MADGREYTSHTHISLSPHHFPLSPPPPLPISIPFPLLPLTSLTKPPVNDQRTARVADLLSDFRTLQYYIASIPSDPPHPDDYYTEGYAALRQCAIDGMHILNCAAETRVPRTRGGVEEQVKAELQQ